MSYLKQKKITLSDDLKAIDDEKINNCVLCWTLVKVVFKPWLVSVYSVLGKDTILSVSLSIIDVSETPPPLSAC